MHGLNQIIRMNEKAARSAAVETNFERHCSFSGTAHDGVVLHSAKLRNTVFLRGAKDHSRQAAGFLAAWWSTNSQQERNTLVESYFE